MTTAVLDPKLNDVAVQISSALSSIGGPSPGYYGTVSGAPTVTRDASTLAASLLSAYQSAVMVNPSKAFQTKAMTPTVQLGNRDEITDKNFWDDVWTVVQTAGPIVVNALNKDYKPESPNLASIIQTVPAHRRGDKDWVDFTTHLLLNLAQGTVQALSGQKDFSMPGNRPQIPAPPPTADKSFIDDALGFVQRAAPVALPIIMSII